MATLSHVALPVSGSILEGEIRRALRGLGYAPCYLTDTIVWVETHGSIEGCDMIEPDDQVVIADLIARHTGHQEYPSAADWPAWTDDDVWETTPLEPLAVPEPFDPSPEDRQWWASERARLDSEDVEWTAAQSGALDLLSRGLTPADLVPVRVRITDEDMARVGAVG